MREFSKNVVGLAFSLPTAAFHLAGDLSGAVTSLAAKGSKAVCDLGCATCAAGDGLACRAIDEVFDAVERVRGVVGGK